MKDNEVSLHTEFSPGNEQYPFWYAELRPEKFRLIEYAIPRDSRVYSYEVYESLIDATHSYARINLRPSESCVWTVVLGSLKIIDRHARHDHKLAIPWTNVAVHDTGVPLLFTQEIENYPALSSFLYDGSCSYYVRPSSFALSRVNHVELFGKLVKIVTMQYMLEQSRAHEFFAHIHSSDETDWLTPMFRALLVTNSPTYVWHHPELNYSQVHPSQPEKLRAII